MSTRKSVNLRSGQTSSLPFNVERNFVMLDQPMETQIKSYKDAKEYQRDVQKMSKQGWTILNTIDHQNERSLAGKLLVPGGMFTKGKSQIVVTYQRPQQEQMPTGLSFKEQVRWRMDHPK